LDCLKNKRLSTDNNIIIGTWKLLSFEIIEEYKIFITVLVSLLPNWTNKEHFRHFQILGNSLTFQTPTYKQGNKRISYKNWVTICGSNTNKA
jgi:hypothetical protein